ncbi:MAG: hypothetical protein ACTTH0_04820 [Eubacteriales bacterium]
MQELKEKKESNMTGIQIGISSLLLIFTVVCIVIFCVLSFSSARADYALAMKSYKATKAYYDADVQGEKLKKQLNEKLIEMAPKGDSALWNELENTFPGSCDRQGRSVTFKVDTAYEQMLQMRFEILDVAQISADKQNFSVKEWQILNKEEYEISTDMPVWTGE